MRYAFGARGGTWEQTHVQGMNISPFNYFTNTQQTFVIVYILYPMKIYNKLDTS